MRVNAVRNVLFVVGAGVLAVQGVAYAGTKCTDAITKEASKFLQAKAKILQQCEAAILLGKADFSSPPGQRCNDVDGKTSDKIADVQGKFAAAVRKACCGKDGTCGTVDDQIGAFGLGVCPSSDGPTAPTAGCGLLVSDPGDVASCLVCLLEEQADETIDVAYGAFDIGPKGSALNKCQTAIGKATMTLLLAKSKILAKCEAGVLKGKVTPPCPDAKSSTAIDATASKQAAAICKACGGSDKDCGGAPDQSIAAIGAPATCPPLLAGGASSGPITDLAGLIDCVTTTAGDRAQCSDAFGATVPSSIPGKCVAPATACTPSGGTTSVAVKFEAASGVDLAAMVMAVGYRNASIPTKGDLGNRLTTPQGGITVGINRDSDLLLSIVSIVPLDPPTVFNVQFDRCGAPPTAADFSCLVIDASDSNGEGLDSGVRCFVEVP